MTRNGEVTQLSQREKYLDIYITYRWSVAGGRVKSHGRPPSLQKVWLKVKGAAMHIHRKTTHAHGHPS